MARNDYFLEKADIIIMVLSIQCFAYVLFRVDHITIIYSLLYINLFLFIAFLIFKHFTNKKREFEKELEKELKKEDELKKKNKKNDKKIYISIIINLFRIFFFLVFIRA